MLVPAEDRVDNDSDNNENGQDAKRPSPIDRGERSMVVALDRKLVSLHALAARNGKHRGTRCVAK